MCVFGRVLALVFFMTGSNVVLASTVSRLSPNTAQSSPVTLYASKWLYHLEPEYRNAPVLDGVSIDLLKNETGYIQLHIDNPNSDAVHISTISPKGFESTFFDIAKVYEIDHSGKRIGTGMLDPLRSLGTGADLEQKVGIDLLLKFSPSDLQFDGATEGAIRLQIGDSMVTYSVSINVNSLAVDQGSIGTQIFNLDSRSLSYEIGLPIWHPRFREYAISVRDLLADHHISPSRTPFVDAVDWSQFPNIVEPNESIRQHLLFAANDKIALPAPKFEQLATDFSMMLEFSSAANSIGEFVQYVWGSRSSGIKLSLENSKLEIHLGNGEEFEKYYLTEVKNHADIHRLKIQFSEGRLNWSLGEHQSGTVNLPMPAFRSAYGGEFFVHSEQDGLRLYDVTWLGRELDYVSFDQTVADLGGQLTLQKTLTGDGQSLAIQQHLSWLESKTLWENDVSSWLDIQDADVKKRRPSVNSSHVALPRDEAVKGPAMAHNIRAAEAYKKSGYKIFHTLGSMHNKGIDRKQVLQEYAKYVDILSVRPRVFLLEQEFFKKYEGEVSLYLHDTHWEYTPDNLMNARLIFWFGHHHGINMYSYWNVNTWYQPYKSKHRVARFSRRVGNDFEFSKRNPSGIHSGVLIYPGDYGPLSSLQLISWSKGIEDQWLLTQAKEKGIDSSDLLFSGGMGYATWARSVRPQDFRKKLGSTDFGQTKFEIADRIANKSQ